MSVLAEIELDEIADELFVALDAINVENCWGRSGRSRDGYTSPDEAAAELVEEELRPFFEQIERYHDLGMADQEASYCMGVIFGCYRYGRESKSEFREWCVDLPGEFAHVLLDKWQKRTGPKDCINRVHKFVREHCPQWTKWLREQEL